MRLGSGAVLGVLLLASVAAPLFAADSGPVPEAPGDPTQMTLDEVLPIDAVYGASRYEQKVTRAPSSVTIVTSTDIRRYGYRTLADILDGVRGFYTTFDRNYTYLGARGFSRPSDYNSRILILIDGHRINDNIYGSAFIGTEEILDVDLIDRVEVIRGPSSSLYGTSAFFGVINVVTRRGRQIQGLELSGDSASYRSREARVSYGATFRNGLEIALSNTTADSGGQRLFFEEFNDPLNPRSANGGVAENADDDRYDRLLATLSWRNLTLQAGSSSREKGIPTAPFGTVFDDSRNRTLDRRDYADLKYARKVNDKADVLGRIYFDRYYYRGDYLYDYPPVTLFREQAWGYWWGGEAKYSAAAGRHTLTAGAEYRANVRQDYRGEDRDPFFLYDDRQKHSVDWGGYLQDEYAPSRRLTVSLGLRHDRYESFGGTTNPRLAFIYNPFENTTLKLLLGQAFRAPNTYELFYGAGANPSLGAERIKTGEIVLEQYFRNNVRLAGSAFAYDIDDLISFDIGSGRFMNLSSVQSRGVEFEMQRKWNAGVDLKLNATYQETRDEADNSLLTNSPRTLGRLTFNLPLRGDSLSAGTELQYTSRRRTLAGAETGGFVLVNLTLLSRNLARGLDLSASLYNLLDRRYGDPGSDDHLQDIIPQNRRNFRIKLTWRF
ncbi:MAG TPA: TonB-dependent receptor [Candidatus Polarisedimenticolia bacterium]|nr:TonB-dependent receptor [Candidatus Polarisedimenticolia bacterium]